jgi:SRSO17 transposase
VLSEQADALLGGEDAVLVVDDTALPKKGTHSVGVAAQYCGELGKQASCQSLVSLTLARGEVAVPVGLRLFLPASWIEDAARCSAAGLPEHAISMVAVSAAAFALLFLFFFAKYMLDTPALRRATLETDVAEIV